MSAISALSAGSSSTSAAVYLPTFLSLQSELLLYSRFATGTGAAATDFQAFQYALETRNIANAQTELARLRRDSIAAGAPALDQISAQSADGSTNNGIPDTTTPPPSGTLLEATA